MILDIHTHNFHGYTDAVIAGAKAHGIDRLVFLGDVLRHGMTPTPEQIRQINDDTLADVRRFAPQAVGFCHLNPEHDPEFLKGEIDRCLALSEFRGVKLEAAVNCRDARQNPIMEQLEKYDRALLQHCWFKTSCHYPGESDPSDVAELARRFPRVKIIMAHLCGCGIRGVELVADCPNVMIDTSGGQPEDGILQYAVRRIGAERIVYGSDAPCRDFGCQLAKVREAGLKEAELERILFANARELLQW